MTRRPVRVVDDLFNDRDAQLATQRGPAGEPSRFDFLRFDLIEIIERVGRDFESLPEVIPGRPEYRMLATRGRLAAELSVIGHLAPDGVIDLIQLDLGLEDQVAKPSPGQLTGGVRSGATFEVQE